jgi:hypothetical protein
MFWLHNNIKYFDKFNNYKMFMKCCISIILLLVAVVLVILGHAVAQLVEALCYKPEGRGFDSRSGHWIFQLT